MNRIRECRESKGYSQKYLSIVMGVSQPTVYAWESGKASPTKQNLVKLSNILNESVDYLIGISDTELQKEEQSASEEYSPTKEALIEKIKSMSESQLLELRGYISGRFGK